MIIVRLNGGLGNQMFQISLGKVLEINGKIVLYDNIDLKKYLELHNWDEADNIFDLKLNYADNKSVEKYSDKGFSIIDRVRKKILGSKKTHYFEKSEGTLDDKVFDLDNVYIDGYWQTDMYFHKYADIIIKMFKFKKISDLNNLKFIDYIKKSKDSIGIHVRLGDYTSNNNLKIYGGICTNEYYDNAIRYMLNKFPNAIFFIFSNDKSFLNKYDKEKNKFIIVDCNDEKNAWKDMYLMSLCKHNIIANSTFSWWGAYLNRNNNKIIVAPKRWLNTQEMKDICPKNWIRL